MNVVQSGDLGTCSTDTGGTCSYSSCASSRGRTSCSMGKCLCQSGYCAAGGRCVAQTSETYEGVQMNVVQSGDLGTCSTDTGGTCSYSSCSSSRGKTSCLMGKCL